jgi:hypothetical protein
MYSGTTLTSISGIILGAHQKFDRVARKQLSRLVDDNSVFPKSRQILHFEGHKGPDAIKRKSPSKDEPWHYYSPFDNNDSELIELITDHYNQLIIELKKQNKERIAFEAAWLAHAIVDGLTPAHHYPYEEKLNEIRGEGKETRNTIKKKVIVSGANRRDQIKNNWKVWGPRGLLTTHGMFEIGVATIIAPLGLSDALPNSQDLSNVYKIGPVEVFKRTAREIAILDMYERFRKKGWSTKLVIDVRNKLAPSISKVVTLFWYMALIEAGLESKKNEVKGN